MNAIPDFPAALTMSNRELLSRRVTRGDAAALTTFLLGLSSQSRRMRYC